MTGTPIDDKNPEVLTVAVEANADEYITVGAKIRKINKYSDEIEIDLEERTK